MLNRYRRDAESIAELNLGWFVPLHEAIAEFAELGPRAGQDLNPTETANLESDSNADVAMDGNSRPPSLDPTPSQSTATLT
jgi:hypothetical protein